MSPMTIGAVNQGKATVGNKRLRSPTTNIGGVCKRCFRSSHTTAKCCYQVVCRRCKCTDYVAINYPLDPRRSPRRKKNWVRTQKTLNDDDLGSKLMPRPQGSSSMSTGHSLHSHVKHSIPIPLGIARGRQISEKVLIDAIPTNLNAPLMGPITSVNDDVYLLPMASKEKVKMVSSLGVFELFSKKGLCSMSISPWSADLNALGRASGHGQWMLIWNVPLHGWCYGVIIEILKPVGKPNKSFISALVRRWLDVTLPVELDLSFGMRHYQVLITGDRG